MKKCPVGGLGTVDARIPFSQSVACGPTMEMSPLLGSRTVDGPALTRDATAGGSLGIGDEGRGDPCSVSWKMAVRNGGEGGLAIGSPNSAPNTRHLFSFKYRGKVYLLASFCV